MADPRDLDEQARLAEEEMQRAREIAAGMNSENPFFQTIRTPAKDIEDVIADATGQIDVSAANPVASLPIGGPAPGRLPQEQDLNIVLGQVAGQQAQVVQPKQIPKDLPDVVAPPIQAGAGIDMPLPDRGLFGIRPDHRAAERVRAAARQRYDRQMFSGVGVETVGPGYQPAGPIRRQDAGSYGQQMQRVAQQMGAIGHGAPMGHGRPMFNVGWGATGSQDGWSGSFGSNVETGQMDGAAQAVNDMFRFFERVTQAVERQGFNLNDLIDRLDVEDGGDHEF